MLIVWREQMSVGIKVLDDDHRHLIDIINQLVMSIAKHDWHRGERQESLRVLLSRLKSYTHEHFAREEAIQANCLYPGLIENQEHHQELISDLESLSSRFLAPKEGESQVGDEEMISFLRRWLIEHIIKVDLKMRGHVFTSD